jgi:hypothetical protein
MNFRAVQTNTPVPFALITPAGSGSILTAFWSRLAHRIDWPLTSLWLASAVGLPPREIVCQLEERQDHFAPSFAGCLVILCLGLLLLVVEPLGPPLALLCPHQRIGVLVHHGEQLCRA